MLRIRVFFLLSKNYQKKIFGYLIGKEKKKWQHWSGEKDEKPTKKTNEKKNSVISTGIEVHIEVPLYQKLTALLYLLSDTIW